MATGARTDLLVGTIVVLGAVPVIVAAINLPPPRFEPLGARFLALVIPGVILAIGLGLVVRSLRHLPGGIRHIAGSSGSEVDWGALLRGGGVFASFFVYVLLIHQKAGPVAYIACGVALATVFSVLIGGRVEPVRNLLAGVVGGLVSAGIVVAFTNLFYTNLFGH